MPLFNVERASNAARQRLDAERGLSEEVNKKLIK
jgi:hypothetical protein